MLQDLEERYALPASARETYKRDGYVKLSGVLAPETLAHYGAAVSEQVARDSAAAPPMEQRDTYGKAFLQVMNIWTRNETVREFSFSRKLARIAAELMGVDGVRMYHDQALYKEPGGGHTPWHADQYYWPLSNANCVTAWVPLQETPLEMGPLEFSAGSQKHNLGRELRISDDSEERITRAALEHRLPLHVSPYALGEVSFHCGWVFHRAGPNRTDQPRRAMTVIYMEDGMRLKAPANTNQQADWDTWMPGARVGEVIATQLNPVLYHV